MNNVAKKDLPDILKELRHKLNRNQGQFAKDLGVSQQLLSAVETGRIKPSYSFIRILCDKTSLNLKEMLRYAEKESNPEEPTGQGISSRFLSPDENHLLGIYRELPEKKKAKAIYMMMELKAEEKEVPIADPESSSG